MTRPIPLTAIDIIKRYEGCKLKAYQDISGIWTIGYGHTEGVNPGMVITEEQAEEFLREDLQAIAPLILKLIPFNLNNHQYSALLSLVYNIGIENFKRSELLKLIDNKPENESRIVTEMVKWDKAQNGQFLYGLMSRRRAEAALYFTK